jgi:hypothetical protein
MIKNEFIKHKNLKSYDTIEWRIRIGHDKIELLKNENLDGLSFIKI